MDKGVLYGISVGPGAPELLTLKALRVLEGCPVIAAPRTPGGGMVALEIIRPVVALEGKELLPLDFSMSPDAAERAASHQKAAGLLRAPLEQGRPVAMLNLGDVSLYASFQYVADLLRSSFTVEMVPGVPSFCAAAARLGISLTEMDKPLHLIPGGAPQGRAEPGDGTRVYMKSGRQLRHLLDALERKGALAGATLVQNCGMANEAVFHGVEAKKTEDSYFSIVIVKE